MSLAYKKFNEAEYFFHQLEIKSFDSFLYNAYLGAFIETSRNITFVMQNEGNKRNEFNDWYKSKQIEMKEDKLMVFFHQLRTYSVHTDNNIISSKSGMQMRHPLSFDEKGGCKATFISRDGSIIREENIISDPNAEWFLGGVGIPFNSGLWEVMYFFDEIEKHPLANINITSVTDLCFEYLKKLRALVDEYDNMFINL